MVLASWSLGASTIHAYVVPDINLKVGELQLYVSIDKIKDQRRLASCADMGLLEFSGHAKGLKGNAGDVSTTHLTLRAQNFRPHIG